MINIFLFGAKAMLPITTGVIPFGLVMGTVASNAGLSLFQTLTMNILVFAGAAQLASVDLLTKNAPAIIVILTGITINLRFILYSAALSSTFKHAPLSIKIFAAYTVTDQTYSALMVNEKKINNNYEAIQFYIGSAIVMILAWQASVTLGFIFGNIAPSELSLDYAVPLSFIALVMPTLKNRNYYLVALLSCFLSIVLKSIPYNLGLLASALISISFGAYLSKKKKRYNEK